MATAVGLELEAPAGAGAVAGSARQGMQVERYTRMAPFATRKSDRPSAFRSPAVMR